MMIKLKLVAFLSLLLTSLIDSAAITAKFAKNQDDYVCRVTGQSYTRRDTLVKMYGKHSKKDNYGNDDVTVFFASDLNNDFERIPPTVLRLFINLREMWLESIGLKELDETSFINGVNLKKIIFGKDYIESISANVFSDCESLEEIQFNDNRIGSIDDDAFSNQSGLKALTLKGNNFSSINPALFKPLTGLIELTITDNPIKTLHPDSFLGMTKLQALNLNNNELVEFSTPLLRQKNQLTVINLNYNKIATIDGDILQSWPNNAGLYVIDNICISKAYDQLGTDEWPMDEAAKDMKSCFKDNEDSLKVVVLEPTDVIVKSNQTSLDSLSLESDDSSQSIEDEKPKQGATNQTDTAGFNLFSNDGKAHDEDSDEDFDIDSSEYENEKEYFPEPNGNKANNATEKVIKPTDVEPEKSIESDSDEDDSETSEEGSLNKSDQHNESETDKVETEPKVEEKHKVQDLTTSKPEPPKVEDLNTSKSEPSNESDESNEDESDTREEPAASTSDVIVPSTPHLHPYEQAKCRFYISARNQYTCVLENAENTLKHIIIEHMANYSNENVSVLFIRDSNLITIPRVIFDTFPNLKALSVENSGIKSMDSDLFEKCGDLKDLDLSNNKIERVKGNSLQLCETLETVNLTNNPIDRLENSIFLHNPKVTLILGELKIVG